MIVTIDHVHILDKSESLAKMILQSEVMKEYERAYIALQNDEKAQRLIQSFTSVKERYEEVERFGRYHPDYAEIMKKVRSVKREMDMNEFVAEFKRKERELQRFLDDISEVLAKSVSNQIIVPREDRLYEDQSCTTGGCATGGACGCSAS